MDFQLRPGVEEELADSKENNSDKDAVPRDPKSGSDLQCLQAQRGLSRSLRVHEFPSPLPRVPQGIVIDRRG